MPVLLLLLIDWLGEKGRPEPVRSGGGRACLSELNCGDTRSLYNGQQRGCVCVCVLTASKPQLTSRGRGKHSLLHSPAPHRAAFRRLLPASRALAGNMCLASGLMAS